VLEDLAPYANADWERAALHTNMAIAIFRDDRNLFESTVPYAVNGAGNGSITHTIIAPDGQEQESARDQPHTQLGLGALSPAVPRRLKLILLEPPFSGDGVAFPVGGLYPKCERDARQQAAEAAAVGVDSPSFPDPWPRGR
jgi:hypothetical protein